MTRIYDVELKLIEPMLGTVPKDRELYTRFIETKKAAAAAKAQKEGSPEAVVVVEDAMKEVESETVPHVDGSVGWTSYHKDEKGIFVYNYFIKGFIKNVGNILKDDLKQTALKSKLTNFVFIFPRRVYILDEETHKPLMEPDGVLERPLRAETPQGPRVALAKSDTVNAGRLLRFELHLINGNPFKDKAEEILKSILEYGKYQALGQWRNASYGSVEVTSFKRKE